MKLITVVQTPLGILGIEAGGQVYLGHYLPEAGYAPGARGSIASFEWRAIPATVLWPTGKTDIIHASGG